MHYIIKWVYKDSDGNNVEYCTCLESFSALSKKYQSLDKCVDVVWISVFIVKEMEQIL